MASLRSSVLFVLWGPLALCRLSSAVTPSQSAVPAAVDKPILNPHYEFENHNVGQITMMALRLAVDGAESG
ncbi:MAG: hypothetical protein NVS1B16_13150 [Pseudarthrobacter sp.]